MIQIKDSLVARADRGIIRGASNVFEAANATHPAHDDTIEVHGSNVIDVVASPVRPARRRVVLLAAALLVLGGIGTVLILDRDEAVTHVSSLVPNGPDMWGTFPSPPLSSRSQFLAVATDTGLLVWGGYNDTSGSLSDGAYWDQAAQTWTKLPPAPLDQTRGDAIGVWTGSEVVVLNGVDGVKAAAFDPDSFTWRTLPSPAHVTAAYNASTRLYFVDGTVLFVHIHGDSGTGLGGIDMLDLATSTWRASTGIPSGFAEADVRFTSSADNLYALVTQLPGCGGLQPVFLFNIDADTWTQLATDTPFSNWSPGIFAWAGDRLVMAGGTDCATGASVPYATALDPAGAFSVMSSSPLPLQVATGGRYPDADWNGELLGMTLSDGHAVTYSPSSDFWHVGPTRGARFNETPTTWLNGQLVTVFPGLVNNEDGGSACCRPQDDSFAYTPPLPPIAADMAAPGIATTTASEPTADSEAAAQLAVTAVTAAGWTSELREHATRTTPDGMTIQWTYLTDTSNRRLFITIAPTGQLDSFAGRPALQASRNTAGDLVLVWPDDPGATTIAIDTGNSTIIVRSEAIDTSTGTARPADNLIALAKSIAAADLEHPGG